MRRFTLFSASTAALYLWVGLQTGVTQNSFNGASVPYVSAFVLPSNESTVHSFTRRIAQQNNGNQFDVDIEFRGVDGSTPTAPIIEDATGNLYGTTVSGGGGYGVVFKLDATSKHETVVHAFGGFDGAAPHGAVVCDNIGNLYGTTSNGGNFGLGTVFMIDSNGVETVLHSFVGDPDGANPYSGVVMDSAGNLYGTTENGGTYGYGTIFKIDLNGNESVLYSFAGGPIDGADPKARLILDAHGNLFGTTYIGGSDGFGTVFEFDTNANTESVLYTFTGGADGGNPFGGVTEDANGALYGTTEISSGPMRPYGCCKGLVYVLNGNSETVLYTFTGGNDGGTPASDLVLNGGILYGTTLDGGPGQKGTVFSVAIATGVENVLHGFTGGGDGGTPQGGLLMGTTGILYGTAEGGGRFHKGTVFQQDQSTSSQ